MEEDKGEVLWKRTKTKGSEKRRKAAQRGKNLRRVQTFLIWSVIISCTAGVWSYPFLFGSDLPEYGGYKAREAESIIRDPSNFKWYVVPLLILVLYFFFDHVERKKYDKIFAAFAFFLYDLFNETYNSLFFKFTNKHAGLWMTNFNGSAYQVLIGWNVEIIFNFLVCGLCSTMLLSKNKNKTYFGIINNRHFWAIVLSIVALVVEIGLNKVDALIWNYWWWNTSFPWLILILGYLPFFEIAFLVYDSPRVVQIAIVSVMAAITVPLFLGLIFLGWI